MMHYGPVSVTFTVYSDFYYYLNGVYQKTTGDYIGRHAVKIMGWGNENIRYPDGTAKKVPYWIVSNTWNPQWGEDGIVKFLRTPDYHQGIATSGIAGFADVPRSIQYFNTMMGIESQNDMDLAKEMDEAVGVSAFIEKSKIIVVNTVNHTQPAVFAICAITAFLIFYVVFKPKKEIEYVPIEKYQTFI